MTRTAVIGGGWTGLAAAVAATEAGQQVTLFEAARALGGRARTLVLETPQGPVTVDNGQHILIGAYTATLGLMQRLGVQPETVLRAQPLALPFADGTGLRTPTWAARWPAPLDALAKLCGFPGKLGMDGSQVWPQYQAGGLEDIRRYCETDVMNTYLVYCRFQKMRGGLTEAEYAQEIDLVQETVAQLASSEPHWREYLNAWTETGSVGTTPGSGGATVS